MTSWRFPLAGAFVCLAASIGAGQSPPSDTSSEAATQREDELRRHVLTDFRDEIVAAKDALTKLQEGIDQLDARIKELLTNDEGKRIAADPIAVMTFVQTQEEPLPSLEQVGKKIELVQAVLASVESRLGAPRIEDLPSSQQRRDVLDAYSWARGKTDRITDRLDSLQALVAAAPLPSEGANVPTLEVAIQEYKNRFARFLNEGWQHGEAKAAGRAQQTMTDAAERAVLEQANQKARIELEKRNAELERLRAEHDVELRRLREQQDQKVADLDREVAIAKAARLKQEAETTVIAEKAQEDAEKVLKIKKCKDSDTKRILAPFLAKGYRQPGRDSLTYDRHPISLSLLRSVGALEKSDEGLKRLARVGSHPVDNERPRWPYRWDYWPDVTPRQRDEIKQAQLLLIELGDVLVEQGMLAR